MKISYLTNFFKSVTPPEKQTPKSTTIPTSENGITWVYIWNMRGGADSSVGHAAIQIGGSKPKRVATDLGIYRSIHPNAVPAAGVLSTIPLTASLAEDLSVDEELIANRSSTSPEPFMPPTHIPDVRNRSGAPDITIQLKGLDTDAMVKFMTHLEEGIQKKTVSYQLFHGLNLFSFLSDAGAFSSQDPVDAALSAQFRKKYHGVTPFHQNYNCTKFVKTILEEGGLPINHSWTPWGITPNALGEKIQEISQQPITPESNSGRNL